MSARSSIAILALVGISCCFESGTRWFVDEQPPPIVGPSCTEGAVRCAGGVLERCDATGSTVAWQPLEDCLAKGMVCAPSLLACTPCLPDATQCDGQEVIFCDTDGHTKTTIATCQTDQGVVCRSGECVHLCGNAAVQKSNVGCEYWAVDLDNAMISVTKNAAAQQYAVVVSNPQPDVPAVVQIHQDDAQPGSPPEEALIAEAIIAPLTLRVFKLGPREVDGSPDGEFDTGTHTALTRHAYRITSDFPVVAYQFNPLANVEVFSNDAALLKPREALAYEGTGLALAYVVGGWPQTIARTDDPDTNFSPWRPINLRAFLTVVATQSGTHVRVQPTTDILPGGPVAAVEAGGQLDITLDAFDVLNLETNDFAADFTGTLVRADAPIAVFVGSEASDAPTFEKLAQRRCCADHLEVQLDPVRTAGKQFAIVHSPSRTRVVQQAGGDVGVVTEPEYVRFVAVRDSLTTVTTSLPSPDDQFTLTGRGAWHEVTITADFLAWSDEPIHVFQVTASQDAAGVPRGLPGGDPSLLVVPPREQYRSDYVFLTPDQYAFDFVMIVAPPEATVLLDDQHLPDERCEVAPADGLTAEQRGSPEPELYAYRCQLSFPTIDPASGVANDGDQDDGVHRIASDLRVGVTVFGFDAYVSYGYAAGTELKEIAPPR